MEEDEEYYDDFEEERPSGESSRGQSLHYITPIRHRTNKKSKKPSPPGRKQKRKGGIKNDLSPQSRLISSKDHEIRTLRNQLLETQRVLKETRQENTIMRRTQVRLEKELMSRSRQEGDIPNILQKHSDEVRALRTQIQRTQINNNELQKRIKDIGGEMWKSQERVKKLDAMVKKRNLPEREQLVFQLQELQEELKNEQEKTTKLDYALQLSQKTHSQEMKLQLGKNYKLTGALEEMREENRETRRKLREKERLLEVTNIYSQRVPGQSQNNSLLLPPLPSTDDTSTQTLFTSPPFNPVIMCTKPVLTTAGSQTDSGWLNDLLSTKQTASPKKEQVAVETEGGVAVATRDAQGLESLRKIGTTGMPPILANLQATPTKVSKRDTPTSFRKTEIASHYKVDAKKQEEEKPVKPVGQAESVSQSDEVRKLLFGSQAPPTQQTRGAEAPPTSIFGNQKKDDLLQKLFPNQTITSKTGSNNQSNVIGATATPTTNSFLLNNNTGLTGFGNLDSKTTPTTTTRVSANITTSLTGLQTETTPTLSFLSSHNTTTTNTGITSLTGLKTTPITTTRQTGVTSLINKPQGLTKETTPPAPPPPQETVTSFGDLSTDQETSSDEEEIVVNTKITGRGHLQTYPPTTYPTGPTHVSNNLVKTNQPSPVKATPTPRKATPTTTRNEELMKKLFSKQSKTSFESVAKVTSSTSSNVSWPERIENMHQGLPAMASETDRYRKSNTMLKEASSNHGNGNHGNNPTTGEIIEEERRKPKHGRRAIGSERQSSTSLFGEKEEIPQKGSSTLFGGGGGGYPWEIPVNTRGTEQGRQVGRHSVNDTDDVEELII